MTSPNLSAQRDWFRGYIVDHVSFGWWVCCATPHCPETLGAMSVEAIDDALVQSWTQDAAGGWKCPQCSKARP